MMCDVAFGFGHDIVLAQAARREPHSVDGAEPQRRRTGARILQEQKGKVVD